MLFTSPAFLFLFFPIALLLYEIVGKKRRRVCLLMICLGFYVLLHLSAPQNLLILPLLTLYTFWGGKLLRRKPVAWLVFLVCALPYVVLILFRHAAYARYENFVYPVGLTVMTMNTTSYLLETARGTAMIGEKRGDLLLYLGFFPAMPAGPFIKYPDFIRMTREETICFDLSSFAKGGGLFVIGFLKRIAVGAVLLDAYGHFAQYTAESADPVQGACLLILIYFGVYFTISGYSDMGCGLARMFGIPLTYRPSTPFHVSVPDEYADGLFCGLRAWLADYVIRPARRIGKERGIHLIRAVTYGGFLLLLIRSDLYMAVLMFPMILLEYVISRWRLEDHLARYAGLRILSSCLTMLLVSVGWVFITMGDFSSLLSYLAAMTHENSEYYLDLALINISFEKYAFVGMVALLTILPGFGVKRWIRGLSPRGRTVAESVMMAVLFTLFVFTILFFLPEYSCYDSMPFRYVYI